MPGNRLAMCYCHTCKREYSSLGIMSHRAMHRRNRENCEITFSTGITKKWKFSEIQDDK
jgi:hypothetical protein